MAAGQFKHDMLVHSTHDEHARQCYVADLRFNLLNEISPGMKAVYGSRVKPGFEREHGRAPKDKHEVHQVMMQDPYTRTWSTMMRSCQEMMWASVIPSIERQLPSLIDKAKSAGSEFSTLELDDSVEIPRYVSAIDIHCMPGGYHTEHAADDVAAGALYDRGVFIYQMGLAGECSDGIGRSVAEFIKRKYPDFKPKRILDVGCTLGHNTGPFCQVFPDAEVHAIDCTPGLLRYAHGRAESLQLPIQFHQMDAREMSFEDDSFDIVFSCILFHETSHSAHRQILRECRRVLKPSGLSLNMELPPNSDLDPYQAFQIDWDAYYNNEPYYAENTSLNPKDLLAEVGFEPDRYLQWLIPDFRYASTEEFDAAANRDEYTYSETGRWGEVIHWYGYGAWN